jgi:putative glycosyltransferase
VKLSVVATLYRSAEYVEEFHRRVSAEARQVTDDYEIVLVDDGSPDDSLAVALRIVEEDPHVRVIELSRNFGHHPAMMTGLDHARGDLVFLIDSDLEEPPELLSQFLTVLREDDLDVVYGRQRARKGSPLERIGGRIAWSFLNLMLPVRVPMNHSTVRLMRRAYVEALVQHRERLTAVGGLWVITGFRQRGIEFDKSHRPQSTYSLSRRLIALLDSVTSFSERPLFLIFYIGCFAVVTSLVAALVIVIRTLNGHLLAGWASTVVSIWFFGGMTIFSVGVVGLYISRIFIETKARPYALIRSIHGGESVAAVGSAAPVPTSAALGDAHVGGTDR